MKIAIEVNGVLRDTVEKFRQIYEKHMIDENNLLQELEESIIKDEVTDFGDFEYKILSEVTSLSLINHFSFKSEEEYFSFIYEEFPMQIFGHAPSTEMTTFNDLNNFYLDFRDEHDITIISDEMGKSKPSTLFFLSKFGCLVENIVFYNTITKDKVLSNFDLIVTSNPEIIINYSDSVKVIKYETNYNKQVKADYSINSLKELAETVKKISNVKTIQ